MQERAQAPKINSFGAVSLEKYFRSGVFWHTRYGKNIFLSSFNFLGKAEISQLDQASLIDHDIFWFEVAVDDVPGMQVIQSEHDLRNVKFGPV